MRPSPDGRPPVVAIWGTFDVDNYGDHLFPLIAQEELARRLAGVRLRPAAPYGHFHPTRFDGDLHVDALPAWSPEAGASVLADVDVVLVGGGEIMHGNDRMLAPVYGAPPDELARLRPSGWFLEAAAQDRRSHPRFVLHAVGITHVDDDRVPAAVRGAAIASVRDPCSAARLRAAGVTRTDLDVVPDTAFLLDRLFADDRLDAAITTLRSNGHFPIADHPLVVQGCDLLVPHAPDIAAALRRHDADLVVVETGRGRGDHEFADALIASLGRRIWRVPATATVVDIAAAIRASGGFVGSSLHGAITAAVFGRPFVTLDLAAEPKLHGFGIVTRRPECVVDRAADIHDALAAARRRAPDLARDIAALQRRVDEHFDRVAALAVERATTRRHRAFWNRLGALRR